MTLQRQPGFFDIDDRAAKLTERGDPLVKLKAGLLNLAYHMKRLVQLTANETRRQLRRTADQVEMTAPAVA
jgi:hypothetical protein